MVSRNSIKYFQDYLSPEAKAKGRAEGRGEAVAVPVVAAVISLVSVQMSALLNTSECSQLNQVTQGSWVSAHLIFLDSLRSEESIEVVH